MFPGFFKKFIFNRFFKVVFKISILFFVVFAIGLSVWIFQIDNEWSPLIEPKFAERNQQGSVRVLAFDPKSGAEKWLGSLSYGRLEERRPLELVEFPNHLIQSVLVLEDPRFLDHKGFDILGILRAVYVNIVSLRYSQGGSTLTQQLVKNVLLTSEKTIKRKFTEIILAALIEKRFTKDQILEAYLNEIYLGQIGNIQIHGVGRGSEYYFGKPPKELEIHESALLAAMIAGPGIYSPWKNPEKTRARRDRVLKSLMENEFLLQSELELAMQKPLPKESPVASNSRAPYLMDALRKALVEEKGEINVLKGGFDVEIALDLEVQEIAENALLQFSNQVGPEHQALIVGADPQDCTIKFYVGGTRYSVTQLDRIQQSRRPIGSLMKPLEIAPLLENDSSLQLSTLIEDKPLEWSYDSGRGNWKPENYDKKFRGPVSLRTSIEESLNIPIIEIFKTRFPNGILNDVFDPLRAHGLKLPPDRALPSAILGSVEQTPWDVLLAYLKLTRQTLGLAQDAADFACNLSFFRPTGEISNEDSTNFGQAGARLVMATLEGALRRGTSRSLGGKLNLSQAWAGKTGSSSDLRDAWYAALSPNLVALAWTGRDDNGKTKFTGASGALPLLEKIISFYAENRSSLAWTWPLTGDLFFRPLRFPELCRPSETEEALMRSSLSQPTTTTPPPQAFEHNGKNYIWELFKKNSEAPFCATNNS